MHEHLLQINRLVTSVVMHIAIEAGGLGFDSRASLIGQCRQRLVTAAMFLRSCVAQALNRGDEPRHLLHATA